MRAEFPCPAVDAIAVPRYLAQTYWWAYVHPRAVKLFERELVPCSAAFG